MQNGKKLWKHPWSYRESFIISITFALIGFIIEYFTNHTGVITPPFPINLIIILAFLVYIFLVQVFIKSPLVRWMSSVPAAISSVTIFTVLVLLLGFIPQEATSKHDFFTSIGLHHMSKSWAYFLSSFYMLTILGFTVVRRFLPLNLKNIAFTLNHAGLWLVIAAASLGSGDMYRLSLQAKYGELTNSAFDKKNRVYKVPFTIKLNKFDIEYYNPNLAIYNMKTDKLIMDKDEKLEVAEQGAKYNWGDWQFKVEKYYPLAVKEGNTYKAADSMMGSGPAGFVIGINTKTGASVKGWIFGGSFLFNGTFLKLDDHYALVFTQQTAKKFSSNINIYHNDGDHYKNVIIQVNKPYKLKGWKIYQTGYDETYGKWSESSVFELVYDPWLPVVYIGIAMLLLGSLYLLWTGKARKSKTIEEPVKEQ
jgi:cytochrome c biogenesis factor